MSYYQEEIKPHLIELRDRIIKIFISLVLAFVVAWSFHNPILSWMTAPLKSALTEVGKIVESRENSLWKLQNEQNSSTKTAPATPLSKLKRDIAKSTKTMEQSLKDASKFAKDINLSRSLAQASISANEISTELKELLKIVSKEINSTKEKSFKGMITTHQVSGAFWVAIKVSFFAALILALPFILWQIWGFVAPALHEHEKNMVLPFVIGGSVMFIVGVLFAYYIVTPFGFQFLITFGSFLYTPLINIEDYVGFFGKIMFGFGLAFELPVFSFFLAKLGLIDDKTLKDFFRYAVVIIFVVAALLTPPDVLTQLLMAGPLIMLYGVSILIVRLVNPHKEEE